jgi:sugar phosphate permease
MADKVLSPGRQAGCPGQCRGHGPCFVGYLSDRFNRPLLVIGLSMGVLATTLSALTVVTSPWAVLAVVAVNSIFIQVYFGPLFSFAIHHLGDANAGIVSGFGNFCANIGGFALVYLLGIVKDATGQFQSGLLTLALLCVFGLVGTVGLSTYSSRQEQPAEVGP